MLGLERCAGDVVWIFMGILWEGDIGYVVVRRR